MLGKNTIKKKENMGILILIAALAFVVASLPLFGDTLFDGHDVFFHTQRIQSIKNALETGQFPVRIYKELFDGHGYGAPLFYPELFLYFPAILYMLGLPLVTSYNMFLMVINAATIITAWYSFTKITENLEIGLLAAILYELCTYRMVDMYTRASMGELLALVFCPLVLCALNMLVKGYYSKWWLLALAFTGLLLSHILTFVLLVIVSVIYILVHIKDFLKVKVIIACTKAFIASVLINLWFLIPFLEVSGMNVNAMHGPTNFFNTDVAPIQLFDMSFLSVIGDETYDAGGHISAEMPITPGVTLIIGAILAIFLLVTNEKKIQLYRKAILKYVAAGAFSTWLITSAFPWDKIKEIDLLKDFLCKFQFIWRFNIIIILFFSLAAAYGYYYFFVSEDESKDDSKKNKSLVLMCMVLCCFSIVYLNQFVKQSIQYKNEDVMQNGYTDMMYVAPEFGSVDREDITSNITDIEYKDIYRIDSEIHFRYKTETGDFVVDENTNAFSPYIEVPITYYPCYSVVINGTEVESECSIYGIIRILIPEGVNEGEVHVYYNEPIHWKIANIVSLLSLILIIFWRIASEGGAKYHGAYFRTKGKAE